MVENFPKAPITEALIDIRVQMPEKVSIPQLENLHRRIEEAYPKKKSRMRWEQKFEFKEGEKPASTETKDLGVDGYLFWSSDEKQVVQFRLDGFTFSRLRPYLEWSQIYQEAKRLWAIYVDGGKPIQVTRLALRYINSIEIPSKTFDLDEYFACPPRIPEGLPQLLTNFFTRLLIQFPDQGAQAFVTLTLSETKNPIITPFLFDIDVFMEVQLNPNDQKIWDALNVLRNIKNEVFIGNLKEKTLELFR